MARKTSREGVERILKSEDFRPTMYYDAAGLPTIGYGTLIDSPQEEYLKTATISKNKALRLARESLNRVENAINTHVKIPLNQNQFDALASFVYNVGVGAFSRSGLLKKINGRAPSEEIVAEFNKWIKAKGKVVSGLIKRRKEEAQLFIKNNNKKILVIGVALLLLGLGIGLGFSVYQKNKTRA